MTGILVTKFKMGQINVEDLEQMAADASRTQRCSAAKRVLEAVKNSPDFLAYFNCCMVTKEGQVARAMACLRTLQSVSMIQVPIFLIVVSDNSNIYGKY